MIGLIYFLDIATLILYGAYMIFYRKFIQIRITLLTMITPIMCVVVATLLLVFVEPSEYTMYNELNILAVIIHIVVIMYLLGKLMGIDYTNIKDSKTKRHIQLYVSTFVLAIITLALHLAQSL